MMKQTENNNDEVKAPVFEFDQEYLVKDLMFENAFRLDEENKIRNRIREHYMPPGTYYEHHEIIRNGIAIFHDESVLNIAWKHKDYFIHDHKCIYFIAEWIFRHFGKLPALSHYRTFQRFSEVLDHEIRNTYGQ